MSTVTQGQKIALAAPGTSTTFTLNGGKYAIVANATGAGTIDLNVLSSDLATFVKAITTIAATTGFANADLPPGQYNVVTTGFTNAFVSITSVPS